MEKVILTTFTDPMMGLSYESEPIMDRLQKEYSGIIEFRNVMGLLVRDVSDFMTPEERSLAPEAGIPLYCQRLARIYKSEESIGGLPINMDGFCLFDKEHRSSKPLNLAYKAAQLAAAEKANAFLIALRHATVIDCLPTTHFDIILKVVRKTGIDEGSFTRYYQDGSAEAALYEDLAFAGRLGIHSLPAYLIQFKEKAILMQSFAYQDFAVTIHEITADNKSTRLLQTDAAINAGNSGGCMLNTNVEIAGISEAKITETSAEGMCYTIPIQKT